ncbi:hypothetical protein BC833DRAFT_608767 [Globomyces pollinis-pini]|nr:hypothetical protein BC833DRAFT_608767 [Globomyces pollinis-pini]
MMHDNHDGSNQTYDYDDDEEVCDLEPWNSMNKEETLKKKSIDDRKKTKSKSNEPEVDFEDTILCRVARKMDDERENKSDPIYYHSKKIIQIEYGDQHKTTVPADLPDSNEINNVSEMEGDVEFSYRPARPQSIVMRPSDIENYYRGKSMQKSADVTTKAVTPKMEGIPTIPFSGKPIEKEYRMPHPKSECHPPVLIRVENSNSVVYCTPNSGIEEWRKQRMKASITMKQLQKIFPREYFVNKKFIQPQPPKKLDYRVGDLTMLDSPQISMHNIGIDVHELDRIQVFPKPRSRDSLIKDYFSQGFQTLKGSSTDLISLSTTNISNSVGSQTNHPYYSNPNQLFMKYKCTERSKKATFKREAKLNRVLENANEQLAITVRSTKKSLPPIPKLSLSSSIKALSYQYSPKTT